MKPCLISCNEEVKYFYPMPLFEDKYCLRGCIVNFRTSEKDIEEIVETIVSEGRQMHEKLKHDF